MTATMTRSRFIEFTQTPILRTPFPRILPTMTAVVWVVLV